MKYHVDSTPCPTYTVQRVANGYLVTPGTEHAMATLSTIHVIEGHDSMALGAKLGILFGDDLGDAM